MVTKPTMMNLNPTTMNVRTTSLLYIHILKTLFGYVYFETFSSSTFVAAADNNSDGSNLSFDHFFIYLLSIGKISIDKMFLIQIVIVVV